MASATPGAEESAAVDANIKALEGVLDEFYRNVPNERKAEIERMLTEFGEQVISRSFRVSASGPPPAKNSNYLHNNTLIS